MMHLTEADLERLTDGEITDVDGEIAQGHLIVCPECAAALARRRARDRAVAALLQAIDDAPPIVSADGLITQASRAQGPRWRAIAAGIAGLGVAIVAAAAAAPHSPLRAYLAHLGIPHRAAPAPQPSPGSRVASVGFAPARVVNVMFERAQKAGEIGVTFGDSDIVRVAHRSGSATYTLTPDGVLIDNAGSRASYEVTLPRSAPVVRIRVGTRTVFARDGDEIVTAASPDSRGRYVIPLAAGGTNR
jgi:hypothetical protein